MLSDPPHLQGLFVRNDQDRTGRTGVKSTALPGVSPEFYLPVIKRQSHLKLIRRIAFAEEYLGWNRPKISTSISTISLSILAAGR